MASVQPRSFGDLLRRYRVAAGLTQEELAERAGLSRRAIGALETGARRAPHKETVSLLAKALNLTSAEQALLESAARQRRPSTDTQANPAIGLASDRPNVRQPAQTLVGRRKELLALERHLTTDGPPLLMLAGEAGIGKSRLLSEAIRLAMEHGWTVLSGGCYRRGGQESYAPLIAALTHFLATRSPAQQRLDLQGSAWLIRLLPELAEYAISPAPSWVLPTEQERRLLFDAVGRFLANVSSPVGTFLILDDLHWADGDTLDLLAKLLREPGSHPLRIAGAYRDTDVAARDPLSLLLGDLTREGLATCTTLPPLNREEARDLLDELLASLSVEANEQNSQSAMVDAALDQASGLPLFLVSWAQELRTGTLTVAAARNTIPWSAAESIRQRVVVLPEVASSLLAVAAVAGRQVSRNVLLAAAIASGQGEADALIGLDAACRARLLTEAADGSYVFTHDLIRETLVSDLGGARRAALHRRVALALEAQPHGERRAAELAWHFAEGDEPARALPYALQAGDQAMAVYAQADARRHYRLALDLAHSLGDQEHEAAVLERLADVNYLLGLLHEANASLERAIGIYRSTRNWERLAWATCQMARVYDALGKVPESMRFVEALLDTLITVANKANESSSDEIQRPDTLEARAERAVTILTERTAARVFLCLVARFVFLGRLDEVYPMSVAAVTYAQRAGEFRMESLAYSFRGIAQRQLGQVDNALSSLQDARRAAEVCGDLEATFMVLDNLASIHDLRAEPQAARQYRLQTLAALRNLGDTSRSSVTLWNLGYHAFMLGNWQEARTQYEEAVAMSMRGDGLEVPLARLALLSLDLVEGKRSLAETLAAPDTIAAGQSPDPNVRRFVANIVAEPEVMSGYAEAARDRLIEVIGSLHVNDSLICEALALLAWAEQELGQKEAARTALADARNHADALGSRLAYVTMSHVEAIVAASEHRWDDSIRALEECLAIARSMPYPYAKAKALYVYGQIHAARGEPEQAREKYQAGLAILHSLGERFYAEQIERALAGLADA